MRGSIAGASGWAQLKLRTHIREVSLGATRKQGDLLGLRGKHAGTQNVASAEQGEVSSRQARHPLLQCCNAGTQTHISAQLGANSG